MKIAGILSTAIMALAAIASPVPSPEDSVGLRQFEPKDSQIMLLSCF